MSEFSGVRACRLATLAAALGGLGCSEFEQKPPVIAGQVVPAQNIPLDFSKRYDVWLGSARWNESSPGRTVENCRILGYTTRPATQSSVYSTADYNYNADWLAVEMADGRKAYFPSNAVVGLIESGK